MPMALPLGADAGKRFQVGFTGEKTGNPTGKCGLPPRFSLLPMIGHLPAA